MGRKGQSTDSGRLGDAMEEAEVELIEQAAKTCRQHADYVLFMATGREAVEAARGMTQEQRAVFVSSLERYIVDARQAALTNAPGRLQAILGFGRVRPETGFDDED